MNQWGQHMINSLSTVAEMAALGCAPTPACPLISRSHLRALSFGLPQSSFTELMHWGPHLLAPTGARRQGNSMQSARP